MMTFQFVTSSLNGLDCLSGAVTAESALVEIQKAFPKAQQSERPFTANKHGKQMPIKVGNAYRRTCGHDIISLAVQRCFELSVWV